MPSRVGDTSELLLRLKVPESEIGGESERDENNQAVYRVEVTIEKVDVLLRPGMTAFARIDFGRQMIGAILAHKIKRALRPELWLF